MPDKFEGFLKEQRNSAAEEARTLRAKIAALQVKCTIADAKEEQCTMSLAEYRKQKGYASDDDGSPKRQDVDGQHVHRADADTGKRKNHKQLWPRLFRWIGNRVVNLDGMEQFCKDAGSDVQRGQIRSMVSAYVKKGWVESTGVTGSYQLTNKGKFHFDVADRVPDEPVTHHVPPHQPP